MMVRSWDVGVGVGKRAMSQAITFRENYRNSNKRLVTVGDRLNIETSSFASLLAEA
jgi:hypothetical protein